MIKKILVILSVVILTFACELPTDDNSSATNPSGTFTVSIDSLANGTITASPESGISGTTIDLTITPDSGYQLKSDTLKYNVGTDHLITGTSFILPSSSVTITAEFEALPAGTYAVIIGSLTNGSIVATPTSGTQGTVINLAITPITGYQLKSGTLKYNDGIDHLITGTSFTMPSSTPTVSAEFEDSSSLPPDTTAPSNINHVYWINTTDKTISFYWINPTDSDFAGVNFSVEGTSIDIQTNATETTTDIIIPINNKAYKINYKTRDLSGNLSEISSFVFTPLSKPIQLNSYNTDNECTSYKVYGYNIKGLQTSISNYNGSTNELSSKTIYTYNEISKFTRIENFDSDNISLGYTVYFYNIFNLMTSYESYDSEGILTFSNVYEFDTDGVLLNYTYYTVSTGISTSYSCIYSENNTVATYTGYDSDNNYVGKIIITWADGLIYRYQSLDSQDSITSDSQYYYDNVYGINLINLSSVSSSTTMNQVYEYNSDNQKINMSITVNGSNSSSVAYEYLGSGDLSRTINFNSDNVMTGYSINIY